MEKNFIEQDLYAKIVELVPLLTVDIIFKVGGKYVLVKRKNQPLKDQFWVIGGRVLKDESIWEAASRKAIEEVGCTPNSLKLIGIYEDSYALSASGVPTHTTSIVFEMESNDSIIKLDNQSNGFVLSPTLPERFLHKLFVFDKKDVL